VRFLRVLMSGGSEDDALRLKRELQRAGHDPTFEHVDTVQAMSAALDRRACDVVICEKGGPGFESAAQALRERSIDVPLLVILAAPIELGVIEATMRAGADDVFVTADLSRLVPALERELRSAENRRERKRLEQRLQESEEKLRLIFENAFDGISIFEESPDLTRRRLVDCNSHYAEMSGRSREELLQIGFTVDIAKNLGVDNSASLMRGVAFRGTFSWIRPDGKDNIIEYTAVPIRMQGRTFTIGIDRDVTAPKRAERDRERLISELQAALSDIKTLSGLVPICSHCKKIRDDTGYWTQVEAYIQAHSQARFSHGICPECAKKLYPDIPFAQ
jgi:PAS domain S-box-containing protein